MTSEVNELSFLRDLAPQLQAEGYEVYLQPGPSLVPAFLASVRPDAIAIGNGKKILIELVTSDTAGQRKTEELARLVKGHPDWELRVLVATPATQKGTLRIQSGEEVLQSLAEVRQLNKQGHPAAALLLAWGTFEAVARRLMSEVFEKPQTPGRLVQYLAQEGYVGPSEGDMLRVLAATRNEIIHGNLHARPSEGDVAFLADLLERLAAEQPDQ